MELPPNEYEFFIQEHILQKSVQKEKNSTEQTETKNENENTGENKPSEEEEEPKEAEEPEEEKESEIVDKGKEENGNENKEQSENPFQLGEKIELVDCWPSMDWLKSRFVHIFGF